jgi:hypothetical protein
MAGSTPDVDALTNEGLKKLVLQLLEKVASLEAENAALREEIARLKGLKGRPKLRPSGMDKATEPKARRWQDRQTPSPRRRPGRRHRGAGDQG